MRRIERLGIELAYAKRVLESRRQSYQYAADEVSRIEKEILAMDGRELEADTGSQPAVDLAAPETERFEAPVFDQCDGAGVCPYWNGPHSHIGGRVLAAPETERFEAPVFDQCDGAGVCPYWNGPHSHIGGRVWFNKTA